MFYYNTEEFKLINAAKVQDLEKRKVVINTASKLYDKILNIYTIQYDNLSEYQKKTVNVVHRPKNLTPDFDEDNLPEMLPL